MIRFERIIFELQEYSLLIRDIFVHVGSIKDNWKETLQEMYLIGTKAVFLVSIGGLFTGIILAIETGHQLETFGATSWIAKTVSLGMVRELGPVIAGLLLAARTGAKNTSELGAMQLSEQIDALKAFGANPIEKLVIPRIIAAIFMFLPLTLIADIIGILGGMLVSHQTFHSDIAVFWNTAIISLKMKDIFVGFLKPFFFGFFIATISCYFGLATKGGTTGLGKNTINAVVYSSALILVIDFIFTINTSLSLFKNTTSFLISCNSKLASFNIFSASVFAFDIILPLSISASRNVRSLFFSASLSISSDLCCAVTRVFRKVSSSFLYSCIFSISP